MVEAPRKRKRDSSISEVDLLFETDELENSFTGLGNSDFLGIYEDRELA